MSDTAAIEWTSRAGVEYKAIHSEDCSLCEYAFGDELCRNSPPCEDKKRADGVSIAWHRMNQYRRPHEKGQL